MGSVHTLASRPVSEIKAIARAILARAVRGELAGLRVEFVTTDGTHQTVAAGRYEDAEPLVIALPRK